MSENTSDSENISKPAPDTAKPKGAPKASKKAKTAKAFRAKKTAAKPKGEGTNKKAEVLTMMKRAKLALAFPTGWTMDALHKLVNFCSSPASVSRTYV
jgi:hypothetical protein